MFLAQKSHSVKLFASVLLLCAVARPSFCQTSKVQNALASYFQLLKQNKTPASISSLLVAGNSEAIVNYVPRFLKDTVLSVRLHSIEVLKEAALKSPSKIVRQKATSLLFSQWGQTVEVNRRIFQVLKKFHSSDFNEATRDSLVSVVKKPVALRSELLRLIGFAGRPEDAASLAQFSTDNNTASVRWSALLAMARLNDEESIHKVVEKARRIKVSDDVVQQLFPDMVYTRQKIVFDYLTEVLQSEQANCESADNDNPTPVLCGYRVMELLAPAIKNYPLSLDASGDVKTWDYKKSLQEVRQWFNNNKNYQIDQSTF